MGVLLYLVGAPGAGKSTLMRALTAGCWRVAKDQPVPHDALVDQAAAATVGLELGRSRPNFPGTDTLAMNISPRACAWVESGGAGRLVLGEGARLGHIAFLDAAARGGYRVVVGYVHAPPDVTDERCASRGSNQNPAWRRGAATRAARLADYAAHHHVLELLDSSLNAPEALVRALRVAVPQLSRLPEAPTCV